MIKHEAQCLGELAARIPKEGNDGALDFLVLGPCCHHSAIVNTEDQNIRDTLCLQFSSLGQVARDLTGGSGGCKCTGQADKHNFLTLAKFRQGELRAIAAEE